LYYVLNNVELEVPSLQLCTIAKNDSAMACYKEMINENNNILTNGVRQKMPELLAIADIQKLNESE
jgi:hypothetical protein